MTNLLCHSNVDKSSADRLSIKYYGPSIQNNNIITYIVGRGSGIWNAQNSLDKISIARWEKVANHFSVCSTSLVLY